MVTADLENGESDKDVDAPSYLSTWGGRNGSKGKGGSMSGLNPMLTTYSVRTDQNQVAQTNVGTYLAHTVCASTEPLGRNGEVIYDGA